MQLLARAGGRRPRTFVALVVLTAWFGSLLVAAPLQQAIAESSVIDPVFTTAPVQGNSRAPEFVFELNADSDPAECQWLAGSSTTPPTSGWGACTTGTTYQPSLPDLDGDYTVWVRSVHTATVQDPNQPDSPTATIEQTTYGDGRYAPYRLDQAGPVLTLTSGPTGTGGTANVSWVVDTAEIPAVQVTCTLTHRPVGTASSQGPITGPCQSGATFPSGPLPADGSYELTATAQDAAENPTTSGVLATYVLDRSGPVLTLASGPTGPGKSTTPTWSVTASGGAQVACRLFEQDVVAPVAQTTDCTSFTPNPVLSTNTTYTLEASATDSSGNTRTQTMGAYVLDTVDPTISVDPSSTTSTTAAAGWTVTFGAGGQTPTCTLKNAAGASFGTGTDCGQFASFTLPAQGSYTLTATTADDAGNSATATGAWLYRNAPTVSVAPTKATGNTLSTTWSVSAPSTSTLTCSVQRTDATPAATARVVTPCAPGTVTTDLTDGDGTYRLTVRATDADTGATGEAFADHVLDTVPLPDFTVTGTSGDRKTTDVSWSWTATGFDSSCQLRLSGVDNGAAVSPCSSPWTTPLTSDGAWTLAVTLYDAAGNATTAVSPEVRLDRGVPLSPGVTTTDSVYLSNNRSPAWTLTGETAASFSCSWTTTVTPAPNGLPASGTCATGYAPTLPDASGTYTLTVTQTDKAGNTSAPTSRDYELDRIKPVVSFASQPASPVNAVAPDAAWTTSGESGALSRCTLVRTPPSGTSSAVYTDQGCGRSIPVVDAGDGSYVLTVTDRDAAGNDSIAVSSDPFVLDRSAPGAPTISASTPTSPSQVLTPSWTLTANDTSGSGFVCRYVTKVGASFDESGSFTACGPDVSWTVPGEGTYRLDVRARDAAGNVSTIVLSDPYVVDRTAPTGAVFTSAAGTGFTTSASWSWTGEAGATAKCLLRLNGTAVTGPAGTLHPCSSPWTEALDKGDGSYTLDVELTDAALNSNTAVTGPAYVLDTKKPDAPVVTGPSGPSKQTVVSWTYTTTETVTPKLHCQLSRAATPTGTPTIVEPFAVCTSLTRTLPTLTADGYYRLSLKLEDAAGNVSDAGTSNPYLLDTTPPAPAVFTQQPSGTSKNASVSWSFTQDAGSRAECQLVYAGGVAKPWAACTSPHAETLTQGDGAYLLQVRLTDAQDNTNAEVSSLAYTLDQTPPGPPTVTGPSGTRDTTTADYAISSVVEAGATAECRLVYNTTVPAWTACTLPRTETLGGDGTYRLEVRLTDQYGNVGTEGTSPSYLLDTKDPSTPVVTAPTSPAKNGNPVFAFTSDADATNTCTLSRGTVVVATTEGCRTSFTGAITGSPDGDYVLAVVSVDAAGNAVTGTSAAYTYDTTAPAPPVVTGPRGPSQNRTPVYSWTAEARSTATCSLQAEGAAAGAFVSCTTPYQPTLPSDGTWVLTVRVTDVAGNTSDPASSPGYVLDTTAPSAPIVVAPSSPGRDPNPSWSATVEQGAVTECRLVPAGTVAVAFAPCTLPMPTPLTADGSYLFEVRATDAAGNVSEIGSASYLLDTVAPLAPVITAPTGPTRVRTVAVPFTIDAADSATCRVSRATVVISPTAPCTSPAVVDLTGQPDGAYTLTVRAVDPAGNVGPAATAVIVLDTTAPAAPVLTLTPGSPSPDRAPTFAFNTESGSVPVCRLTGPGGTPRELACAGTVTLDLTNAADGSYALAITARDQAGNTSAATTATYVLDSNASLPPKVVGPVTPDSNRAPVWKITSTGPTECRLLRSGTTFKDWAPCSTSYLADLFGQPDAVYSFEARLVGSTVATLSRYTLDTSAPPVATITAPPSPGTARTPLWTIASAELGATAECRALVFGAVLRDWAPCAISAAGETYALDLTGRGDGVYTLAVRVTDAARNTGPVATSDYVLDTSAPSAVGVTAPPSPGNDRTPTWLISSVPGVSLECRLSSGQKVITEFVTCAGDYTADLAGLPDGTYTLSVHALSAAGTPGPDTTSSYVLLTTAGAAPGALTGPTGPSRDRAPSWTFALAPGSTATCRVTSNGRVLSEGPCTSPFTMDLSAAPDGTYTLAVRAVDAAGNASDPAVAGYVLRTVPAPAPVFTLVPGSPSSTTNPSWGFSTAPTVTAQCRRTLNGSITEDWAACTSPVTMSLVGQPDGRYGLAVRAVDAAGNTSSPISSDYVFDRTAEPLAVFLSTPQSPDNDLTPTWQIGAPASGAALRRAALTGTPTTQCRLTTPRGAGPWEACAGRYTATTTGDGAYVLELRAADSTGATGPATTSTYVLDTVAPAPLVFTEAPPAVGREAVATWSWTEDPAVLVECRVARPNQPAGAFARCTSPQIVSTTRGEGTYVLEVRQVDAAGNAGPTTSGSYRFDRTPPPAPVFETRPAASGTGMSPTWTFAVPLDSTATCVAARNGTVISEGSCAGAFTLDLRGQQPAAWTVSVRYVDSAGNTGPATVGSYALVGLDRTVVGETGGGTGSAPIRGGGFPLPFPPGGGGLTGLPLLGGGLPLDLGIRLPSEDRAPSIADRLDAAGDALGDAVRKIPSVQVPGIPEGLGVPDVLKNAVTSTITQPELPLALFVIVLLFLLVQNQIDRRDPKLAIAPVIAEPDLEFGPRVAGPGRAGGALA